MILSQAPTVKKKWMGFYALGLRFAGLAGLYFLKHSTIYWVVGTLVFLIIQTILYAYCMSLELML